jgi:hypothetical protein
MLLICLHDTPIIVANVLFYVSSLTLFFSYVAATSTYTKGLFDGVPDIHGTYTFSTDLCARNWFQLTWKWQATTSAISPDAVGQSCATLPRPASIGSGCGAVAEG